MILDSSAVVAIARHESGFRELAEAIAGAPSVAISAGTWFELSIVLAASDLPDVDGFLGRFREQANLEITPFTAEHSAAALAAWRRFGKGNHPARLNFGDCISYATAKLAGESLLFVGDDFAQTDVEPGLGLFNG
jgi:ribonuclease VapC